MCVFPVKCCTCAKHVCYFNQQVFFGVVIGSFSLGNALPEIQTFATALGSATAVFAVIDRVN